MTMTRLQFVRQMLHAAHDSMSQLVSTPEWDSETTSNISDEYETRGLSSLDDDMMFCWHPDALTPSERVETIDTFTAHYERLAKAAAAVLHDAERGIVGTNAMVDLRHEIRMAKDFGVVIPRRKATR